jgi:hypothetical protein
MGVLDHEDQKEDEEEDLAFMVPRTKLRARC